MPSKLRGKSGITLIALIVTIIVLIILAGISVNLLLGENGVVQRAKDAAVEQAIGERKEAIGLAITAELAKKDGDTSRMTVEGVLDELEKAQNTDKIYAMKSGELILSDSTGSTSLGGATFYFPEEINGAAKTGIVITLDENANVTGVNKAEVEDASEVAANIVVQNAVISASVTSWNNGKAVVTATTETTGVSLKYTIGEPTTNISNMTAVPGNGVINDSNIPVTNSETLVYIYAVSGTKMGQATTVDVSDQTAPSNVVVTVTGSTGNSITVSVTATETQSGIANYSYYIKKDNGNYGTAETSENNTHTFTINGQGIYTVKATVTDEAGNTSTVNSNSEKTVDKKGPTITNFAVSGDPTENSITVSVSASDESGLASNGTYTYYKNGAQDGSATTSNTHIYENLTAETTYTLSVVVKDSKGNTTTSSDIDGTTAAAAQQEQVSTMKVLTNSEIDALTNVSNSVKTYLKTSTKIKEVLTGGVPVPVGFNYKEGISTMIDGLTGDDAKNYGVVIEDENHNEWVWIPVNETESLDPSALYVESSEGMNVGATTKKEKSVEFAEKINGLRVAALQSLSELMVADSSEVTLLTDKVTYKRSATILNEYESIRVAPDVMWGNHTSREPAILIEVDGEYYGDAGFESVSEMADYMVTDYNNMIESIKRYGGFYVARYNLIQVYDENENDYVVAMTKYYDGMSISYMDWYENYKACRELCGPLSRVRFSMIWGCQYDAILLYCQKSGQKIEYMSYTDDNRRNNIYDLENWFIWTQEANSSNERLVRAVGDSAAIIFGSVRPNFNGYFDLVRPILYIEYDEMY